ncbi:MAG: OmpA family protein [Spirochaetia bacterium]|nr:OmpA family protein [Spirochaetia bacterium]
MVFTFASLKRVPSYAALVLCTGAFTACLSQERRDKIVAAFTECPCYEETVNYPSDHTGQNFNVPDKKDQGDYEENSDDKKFGLPEGAAARMGTAAYLDKMYEGIKKDFENSGIKMIPLEEGFKSTGVTVQKVKDEKKKTRELLVSIDGDISFAHGQSLVTPLAQDVLRRVGRVLNAYPDIRIKVGGHTDSTGPKFLNVALSQQRAQAVSDQLVTQQKVARPRIVEIKGFADEKKIVDTMAAEVKNRRVEIRMAP